MKKKLYLGYYYIRQPGSAKVNLCIFFLTSNQILFVNPEFITYKLNLQ